MVSIAHTFYLFLKRVWVERYFETYLYVRFNQVALESFYHFCAHFENVTKCNEISFNPDSFLE